MRLRWIIPDPEKGPPEPLCRAHPVTGTRGGGGFAECGASVVLADCNEYAVRSAAEGLPAKGHKVLAVKCDVADDAQVEAMIEQAVAAFGRLDAAYHNAGVQNIIAEAADATREDFDRVIGINLRGVWSCMKFELRQMRKQGSGAIVNCSSIGGITGSPRRGAYQASKHGAIGLTKSAARTPSTSCEIIACRPPPRMRLSRAIASKKDKLKA